MDRTEYSWMTDEELLRLVRNNVGAESQLLHELARRLVRALDKIAEIQDI
jgi:hypothetical protein